MNNNNTKWLLLLVMALFTTLGITAQTTVNFDDGKLPEGWTKVGTSTYLGVSNSRANSGSYSICNSKNSYTGDYIVTPVVASGEVSFYARVHTSSGSYPSNRYIKVYACEDNGDGTYTLGTTALLDQTLSSTTFTKYTFNVDDATHLALVLQNAALDDFTYTEGSLATGPAIALSDAAGTTLKSGATVSLGLAEAGATKTFTIKNSGTEDLTGISVSADGVTVSAPEATTLAAKASTTFTVTLPSTPGAFTGTVTVSATSVDAIAITVSGDVKDPSKFFCDFADGVLPEGWTNKTTGTSGYTTYYGWTFSAGYASTTEYYEALLTTPMLSFTEGETLYFDVLNASTSSYYYPSLTVRYSADGTTFTDLKAFSSTDITSKTDYTTLSVTVPATAKYIQFGGKYVQLTNVYGGSLPQVGILKVNVADNAISFGLASGAVEKTFTVKNIGTVALKATLAVSEGADFTVSPAAVELAAGEEATVTVTMGTTVGQKTGTLTITQEGGDAVTIALSGNTVAEGTWVVDFEDGSTKGWMLQNATVKEPDADYGRPSYVLNISSSYYGSSYAVTPKLTVAEGESLAFDAWQQYSGASLKVSYSTDRETWTTAKSYTLTTTAASQTLTGIPAGDVYLKFEGKYAYIDNIAGFKLADVKHDVTFSNVTIPTTGSCGTELSVTATAKEILGKEETVTATLKIGEETLTADAQTIEAGTTTYLSFAFTPKAVVTDAAATLTLTFADGTTATTAEQTMTISAGELNWVSGYEMDMPEGTFHINYSRQMTKEGWNTLCLPFTVSEADMAQFGTDVKLFEVTGYADGAITVAPSADKTLQASKPYIVYTGANAPTSLEFNNVELAPATPTDVTFQDGDATISFKGTFAARQDLDASNYVVTSDGHIQQCAATGAYAYAGRAVFTLNDAAQAKGVRLNIEGATGINGLKINGNSDSIYNLNGQRLSSPRRGINIINGKKLIVK